MELRFFRSSTNVEWSNQFNIKYWEIWNEPDLDPSDGEPPRNPRCWGGTVEEFFRFFETAAKHLKAAFPDLKIGGPALCGNTAWGERFLAYCRDNGVPLDFFSWHIYAIEPSRIASDATNSARCSTNTASQGPSRFSTSGTTSRAGRTNGSIRLRSSPGASTRSLRPSSWQR